LPRPGSCLRGLLQPGRLGLPQARRGPDRPAGQRQTGGGPRV